MANVPWHEEVVSFVQALCQRLPQYDLACEHEHSNCLLLANTKVDRLFSTEPIFSTKKYCCFSSVSTVNGIHG